MKKKAQSLVEFALVLPLFLLLLLGIIEYGIVFWTKITFDNATRDAARIAVTINDWATNYTARRTQTINTVVDRCSYLPANATQNLSNNIEVNVLPSLSSIETIEVIIDAQPYTSLTGFADLAVPRTMSSRAEMNYEY
jgi:Flp pilus assembly protein TadG